MITTLVILSGLMALSHLYMKSVFGLIAVLIPSVKVVGKVLMEVGEKHDVPMNNSLLRYAHPMLQQRKKILRWFLWLSLFVILANIVTIIYPGFIMSNINMVQVGLAILNATVLVGSIQTHRWIEEILAISRVTAAILTELRKIT